MRIPKAIGDDFRARQVSLASIGLNDLAWSFQDARLLVESLKGHSVAILGGHLYVAHNGAIRPVYDNWYTERVLLESLAEYAARSQVHAKEYLAKYPVSKDREMLVSLTMSDEPTAGM